MSKANALTINDLFRRHSELSALEVSLLLGIDKKSTYKLMYRLRRKRIIWKTDKKMIVKGRAVNVYQLR